MKGELMMWRSLSSAKRLACLAGVFLCLNYETSDAQSAASSTDEIQEIVVTASKTGADVQKIAGAVTAVTGAQLEQEGAQSAKDYLPTIPGVVFNQISPGLSNTTIRGVNTDATYIGGLSQATTGTYINDVPLTDPTFTAGTPDIDTFDVRDIEVYRGPQGTLFGSSSLGGAINYIANTPDLNNYHAAAETTESYTHNADSLNQAYKLMLNAPIIDGQLAVRAVGIFRDDSGYIDNLGTGQRDSNRSKVGGGRFMVEWDPTDATKISFISLYQKTDNADAPYQDPAYGDLEKFTNIPERSSTMVQIDSLRLDQDLGFATLTALASYHDKSSEIYTDVKRFGALGFEDPFVLDDFNSKGETFEARLNSRGQGPFKWLIGAMYDDTRIAGPETDHAANACAAADALLGPGGCALATVGDQWGTTYTQFTAKELAGFGEASYEFAGFTLTLGGREFSFKNTSSSTSSGLLDIAFENGQLVNAPPPVELKENGFTPKASLSYDVNQDIRLYVLASKGYRFGGANITVDPSLPRTFASDSLWNYEAGIKSSWLDKRLVLDADVFDIDWTGIQLPVVTQLGTVGVVNAGKARIRGAEVSLNWQLFEGVTWNQGLTYLDATLTEVNAGPGQSFTVLPDTTLPGASRWVASESLRYQWAAPLKPFVAASYHYVSSAPALLQTFTVQNPTVGDYSTVGFRAGIALPNNLQVSAFVDNLSDHRGVTTAYYTGTFGNTVNDYIVEPRTAGLTISWKY